MDDQLEVPTSIVPKDPQDEENESSDEEGMPDWTNIPGIRGISRAVIPKRGEKEFEPATGGPTALQSHVLTKSRNAMFDALRGSRAANSKTISYAIWYPEIARAHVITARGTHFSTLGHSAIRQPDPSSDSAKPQKRLELMPEEALYLMERGSLFCWRQSEISETLLRDSGDTLDIEHCDLSHGIPMSMQQAFTEMVGTEGLSLHRYIVYAYLKRLGYAVNRAAAPANTPLYPLPPPNNLIALKKHQGLFKIKALTLLAIQPIYVRSCRILRSLRSLVFGSRHSPSFTGMLGLWPRSFSAGSIFRSLRTMKAGHDIPIQTPTELHLPSSSETFKIFWNVWKPSTPWRKLDVPKPDFEISVVDARDTPVPDLHQLTQLFSSVEPRPPPPPRKRGPPNSKTPAPQKNNQAQRQQHETSRSVWDHVRRIFGFQPTSTQPTQGPNPFVHLKAGRKSVIVAAVDGSMVSLVRFGEGDFTAWPMA